MAHDNGLLGLMAIFDEQVPEAPNRNPIGGMALTQQDLAVIQILGNHLIQEQGKRYETDVAGDLVKGMYLHEHELIADGTAQMLTMRDQSISDEHRAIMDAVTKVFNAEMTRDLATVVKVGKTQILEVLNRTLDPPPPPPPPDPLSLMEKIFGRRKR